MESALEKQNAINGTPPTAPAIQIPISRSVKVHRSADGRQRYRARKSDCDACPLRAQRGTKNEPHHIARDVHEDARDVARRKMKTKAFSASAWRCASHT